MAREIERNRSFFQSLDPSIALENFAYPYGLASIWRKSQMAKSFRSARGILPGVNRDVIDLQFLRAAPLVNCEIDAAGIDRYVDEAQDSGGWLSWYTKSNQYSRAKLNADLETLKAASTRNMPIVTVAEALRRIGA